MSARTTVRVRRGALLALGPLLAGSLIAGSGCRAREAAPASAPAPAEPPYKATATIRELMLSVIDPSADVVWLSVTAVMGKGGLVETKPTSDEEWAKVRHGAVTLMEGANLLMMPGRQVAPHGHKSETPGIELEPEDMEALIAKGRAAWNARATALHDVVVSVIAAIDAKDADKLFLLGEEIDVACENCHKHYWYPNEVIPAFPSEAR